MRKMPNASRTLVTVGSDLGVAPESKYTNTPAVNNSEGIENADCPDLHITAAAAKIIHERTKRIRECNGKISECGAVFMVPQFSHSPLPATFVQKCSLLLAAKEKSPRYTVGRP